MDGEFARNALIKPQKNLQSRPPPCPCSSTISLHINHWEVGAKTWLASAALATECILKHKQMYSYRHINMSHIITETKKLEVKKNKKLGRGRSTLDQGVKKLDLAEGSVASCWNKDWYQSVSLIKVKWEDFFFFFFTTRPSWLRVNETKALEVGCVIVRILHSTTQVKAKAGTCCFPPAECPASVSVHLCVCRTD